MVENKICYLCGKPILDNATDDHVPPKQFYPQEYLNKFSLQLLTLPSHEHCNKSYSRDEEYFVSSLGVVAKDTNSGQILWKDIALRVKRQEGVGLAVKVRDEFIFKTEGGIYFPPNKVGKTFEADRIYGVVWKIVRGLFFHRNKRILPESLVHASWMVDHEQNHPDDILKTAQYIVSRGGLGKYPGVFDYKIVSDKGGNDILHGYGLLFWDRIMFIVVFHDPECPCGECDISSQNMECPEKERITPLGKQ